MKKKTLLTVVSCMVLIVLIVSFVVYNSTSWKIDLTVKYIDSEPSFTLSGNTMVYKYEITNNTNQTLKDAKAVFKCKDTTLDKKWNYEDYIGEIGPGETTELNVYQNRMINESGLETARGFEYDFSRIKYNK